MASEIAAALGAARVVWDPDGLRSLLEDTGGKPWRLEGDLDWPATEAVRIVSAGFEDGTSLAVAALRPAGAGGHDAETVVGFLVTPDGEPQPLHEVLISTELGPDGHARRLGLELYEDEDLMPLRAAADGEVEMAFRLEGRRGRGRYDHLTGP